MPKGKGGQFRGFAYVTYQQSGEAMRAFASLDNKIQFGRILHIRPAFKEDKKEETTADKNTKSYEEIEQEKSSFKKKKKVRRQGRREEREKMEGYHIESLF